MSRVRAAQQPGQTGWFFARTCATTMLPYMYALYAVVYRYMLRKAPVFACVDFSSVWLTPRLINLWEYLFKLLYSLMRTGTKTLARVLKENRSNQRDWALQLAAFNANFKWYWYTCSTINSRFYSLRIIFRNRAPCVHKAKTSGIRHCFFFLRAYRFSHDVSYTVEKVLKNFFFFFYGSFQ